MKKLLAAISVMAAAVLLMCAPASQATAAPGVTIVLQNPPPGGLLELGVGESYTFNVLITSDDPFLIAMVMTNAYYPGRGVFWHGSDRATRDTSAVLHLTIKGKQPTAGLPEVCDWPAPGVCWPEGVAPVSIVAGVRFRGGGVAKEGFPFAVSVP